MKKVKRLFEQFAPENYNLEINPSAETLTFSGSVTIEGRKTGRPSQRLTLHQKDLVIKSATVTKHDKKGQPTKLDIVRINKHDNYNEVRLHTDEMVYPGRYTITLEFEGTITKQMLGLYPTNFKHDGVDKKLLMTQFESHHAREVFPCIDEPEAKATFDLSLISPVGQTVLSNTPVKSQTVKGPSYHTVFETTPIMSTYLLAFVIGEIHCVEAKSKNGIEIRTWGTVAQPITSLQYANDEAVRILEYFTEYFQTPFPLKKLDQVAAPDFEAGAMENWGLITYREIALLADADNRSLTSEQYVSMVVGHEISHQWFGNLVTMKWWDDLWLNESFASIMEHIALDALHPDWHQWETYVSSDVISCSNRDIYKDVQPVKIAVHHPDEIGALFDPAIVYAKGGRLLKMLREYIGDPAFRTGLKAYFEKHAYGNTTRDDLWAALGEASGQDIHAFMNPWLEQSGMPVITLSGTPQKLLARQDRFVLDSDNDEQTWPIAVLSDGVEPKLFTTKEAELTDTRTPLFLNEHASAHYIVNYGSGELKDQVDRSFADHSLPSETRVNYLNDLLLLNRRGDLPITETLEVVTKSGAEPRDAVWSLMSRAVGLAYTLIEGDKTAQASIKKLRREVAAPLHARLGWDDATGDDPNTKMLRLTALSWMLAGEDEATVTEALKRFEASASIEALNAEHRGMILAAIVKSDPNKYFDRLIETYKTTPNPDVQLSIAGGLSVIKDGKLGDRLILEALGDGKSGFVRDQDVFRWFAYLMRNPHTRESTWSWFVSNWDRLMIDFGDGKAMDHFVVYAAAPINTADWQKRFNEFFEPKLDIVALTRNIKIAQSEIAARVAWRIRDESAIKKFLNS